VAVILDSHASPPLASSEPATMSRLGPTLGTSRATTCAATMITPLTGRNARPALSGL
jgi:hypothetical protein